MHNKGMRLRGASLAVMAVLAGTQARGAEANAANGANGDPIIVVTAPIATDTARLDDVPANAQVLAGDALGRQNHANLADLLNANLGSVSLSNGSGSPYQSDVAYRGFQATSLLGSPTGLSVWLDGVRMNEAFGAIVNWDLIPMNAVSAVEVLPGSNPVFGLNTLGGALVLTTKNGADNGGLSIMAEGGSFNRRSVAAEAGGTAANKAIDWFLAGNYDEQDGYRLHTHTRVEQLYGKLRWHGAGANAELGAMWSASQLNGTQSLPLSMLSTPEASYTWPDSVANHQLLINLKADASLAAGLKISGNVYFRRSNASGVNSNASLDDNCGESRDCSASAPGGTAVDLYQTNPYLAGSARANGFVAYAGTLPIHDYTDNINTSLVFSSTRQHSWGGNLLLDSDAPLLGRKNDLNLGGSFEIADITYDQSTYLAYLVGYQTVQMPWNFKYGSAGGFEGSPLVNSVDVASHSASFNLFVRDTLKLTETLGLTASLSYTSTHVSLGGTNSTFLNEDGGFSWTGADGQKYYNPAYIGASYWTTPSSGSSRLATASIPTGGVAGPEVVAVTGAHLYHRFNPAVGLAWNPLPALGLFASYSEAMRAPTAIELACADPATPCALPTGFNGDPDLKAVVARTVEVGARGRVGGHVSWNAALYRTGLTNDIQFIYDTSGLGYFANVGRTERRGLELGLAADWARLHLSASYGHVVATYRSTFTDASGDTVQAGNHIPGIPADSFKLRAVYAPTKALALGVNLIAVSSQWAHGDEANLYGAVPGYALVNADLHVVPRPGWELFANITNLFNRHYATYGVMGTNIYTGNDEQFRTPAQGRAFVAG
ncbi:MAG TPA: TonB-dependent receptor, partial [Novosphingobium sp.]|nr:TonB-dependent receptor [Novosphingobium sp.]